jgi:aspartokinase
LGNHVETTATYWEARIKTYGFHTRTELCLFQLTVERFRIALLGQAFCRMGEEEIPLLLTFARDTPQGLSASFVVPRLLEGRVREMLQEDESLARDKASTQALPVEIVFFYGPHFGDRYGIAEATLEPLEGCGIHPMATACSGSCVYLVLPEGRSEEAVRILSQAFEIPRASSQKSPGGEPGIAHERKRHGRKRLAIESV